MEKKKSPALTTTPRTIDTGRLRQVNGGSEQFDPDFTTRTLAKCASSSPPPY